MASPAHLLLTTSASSRRLKRVREEVTNAARATGWSISETSLDALAEQTSGVQRLIVCGGDGLVHRVLPLVAGTEVDVAIIPVGTGNDFARAFSIEADNAVELAVDTEATVREVDLLRAGDRWAASVITGGYSGRVTETANGLRFPPGSAKYTVAAVLEIGRLGGSHTRLIVESDEGEETVIDGDLALYAIANTAWFGGGMEVCPGADPGDGMLDVLSIDDVSRLTFARWLPKVFRGTHTGHRAVRVARGRSVRVESDEHLWADGEPFTEPPAMITVEPGALRLVVPGA